VTGDLEPVFNELIHAPLRLRICGLLKSADELDFSVLRDTLGIDDAKLSKNLKVLAEADLITVRKERSAARNDARRVTWITLSADGRLTFDAHVAALTLIATGTSAR
jgi:DNA-binding MarR family transcriptional regulator